MLVDSSEATEFFKTLKAKGGVTMDNATITITKAEYDALHAKSQILDIIECTVRNDSDSKFGYSSNTRVILETVLGISREKKEKAD